MFVDDRLPVTISVENVEEPGTVRLDTPTQTIQARVEVTAVLIDDDGRLTVVNWQWSRSTNGQTDWSDISGATSEHVHADAGIGRGPLHPRHRHVQRPPWARKTVQAVSPRVGDAPPVNSAPAFPTTEDGRREVPENTAGKNSSARLSRPPT